MVREMKEVLQLLGWGDGFRIPMANDANKELERQVEEMLKRKAEIIVNLEIAHEKEETMKKNLKAMSLEQDYNQKLLNGLSKQLEVDMKSMKDSEISKSQRLTDMKNMRKDLKQLDEKVEKLKFEINTSTSKMNALKESLQWGEDAMFAWQEELAKGEREADILKMYKLQDEERFQKLDLERKQVEADLIEAEGLEKREADRHRILMLQLENVSKLYKEAYNECERLMTVWHDSVDLCHNREEEIKRLTEVLCEIKNRARNKCSELYEQKNFYNDLTRMNDAIKKESLKYQTQYQKLKEIAADIETSLKHYLNERDLRKKTAGNLGGKIEMERMKNSELQRKNKAHLIKLSKLLEEVSNLQQQCDVLKVDTLTTEQKYKNAQDMYEMSCKASDEEGKEVERLYILTVQLKQEINKLKDEETKLIKELELSRKFEKELISKYENKKYEVDVTESCLAIAVTEESILRQKIIELQDKCSGKEEKEELEEEIKELEPREAELIKEHIQLKMRLKSLQKEYREKLTKLRIGEDEISSLSESYRTKKIHLQSDKKGLDSLKEEIQKNRLQLNLLQMKEQYIRENIARDDNAVYKLERQRVTLEAVMRERQLEIEAQKEVLIGKRKSLSEEKAMLGRTIEHLNFRIKQIQSKYAIALDLLGKDDSGKQLSVAHFKIKLAQEKYDLQLEGDDLEAKINKTEKEILAMENTLRLLTAANDNYKVSLEAIDKDDPDMVEKERMEVKYLELKTVYKEDSDLLFAVKNEIEVLLNDIGNVKKIAKELEEDWKIKEKEVTTLEKDLANKQQKLQRATSLLVKIIKDIRKSREPPIYKKLAQTEIDIRLQGERNKSVLQQLAELSMNYVETKPLVNRYLSEYGLVLPHKVSATHTTSSRIGVDTARSKMSTRSDSSVPSVVNLDPLQLLQETPACFKKKDTKYVY